MSTSRASLGPRIALVEVRPELPARDHSEGQAVSALHSKLKASPPLSAAPWLSALRASEVEPSTPESDHLAEASEEQAPPRRSAAMLCSRSFKRFVSCEGWK